MNRYWHRGLLWIVLSVGCQSQWVLAEGAGEWEKMRARRPKGYVCGKVDQPPIVDGDLSDAAWQHAPWTDPFEDIQGPDLAKPRHATQAKIVWDDQNLYIAARLEEPHVWGAIRQHDAVIFQDNDFEVFLDPDSDHHRYLELELNALGTTWDLSLDKPYKDGGNADNGFEFAGLQSAVQVLGSINDPSDTDTAWQVEIAIPIASVTMDGSPPPPPRDGQFWRINFSRVQWLHQVVDGKYQKVPGRPEDNWVWSPQGIIDMHRPERWGYLVFSEKPPGEVTYEEPKQAVVRDLLMEIYHRQRTRQAAGELPATSLEQLGLSDDRIPAGMHGSIHNWRDGWEATIEPLEYQLEAARWCVRGDSRLWNAKPSAALTQSLKRSSERADLWIQAIGRAPIDQRPSIEFLLEHMPLSDLRTLSPDFLLNNTQLAHNAWQKSPWKEQIPKEIFLNAILPYANINERRDGWREQLRSRVQPMIEGAKSLSEAAAMLNQKVFPEFKVRYSTQRRRADQSPLESMESGLASCTGLSVLLIDACRSLGIPARFVGTPLWADGSGNHSWVEVWDGDWHFTGAAEPTGSQLNQAWFVDRASTAIADDPKHAIYAVSYRKTPLPFPMVWAADDQQISAVNVTARYQKLAQPLPEGFFLGRLSVRDPSGRRVAVSIRVLDPEGKEVQQGRTRDESFDTNDHFSVPLRRGDRYLVEFLDGQVPERVTLDAIPEQSPWIFVRATDTLGMQATESLDDGQVAKDDPWKKWLAIDRSARPSLEDQVWANKSLSRDEARRCADGLWQDHLQGMRQNRKAEMDARRLEMDGQSMPFFYSVHGDKPAEGRSLYISMHGGGGAPAAVNDQQWENQKRLYQIEEGVYLAPRAPTNTWDLWHTASIDPFFDRLIENLIVFEEVNPNRIYLLGYSAGGDGVYQLAPRLADRFAAAAMMAGHPNETSPLGLRNLPFTLHMGEKDAAYNRNEVATEFGRRLEALRQEDPEGYIHWVKIHPGKGHWMDRQDAEALTWMAKYTRSTYPEKIVWKQDDVKRSRFYWLGVDPKSIGDRAEVRAQRSGQKIELKATGVEAIELFLSDAWIDLDQSVQVVGGENILFEGKVDRTARALAESLASRGDPQMMAPVRLSVRLREAFSN
jgi:poly(3-hydroxybutyrate) depolymerase